MRALAPSVHNLACTNQVPSMNLMTREKKAQSHGGPDLENCHSSVGDDQEIPPMGRRRRVHRTACSPSHAWVLLSSRDVVPRSNRQMKTLMPG